MKQELDNSYDMSVENMLDMSKEQEIGDFKLTESEFFGKKNKLVKKMTLISGVLGEGGEKQIIAMKDGKFILEVEDCGECEYFFSTDINDLV